MTLEEAKALVKSRLSEKRYKHTMNVKKMAVKLAVRYGAGWAKMWQGLDMEFVRADWRRVLRDFEQNPAAVAHALDSLPVGPRPPTAGEFLQLCEAAPRPAVRMLPRAGSKPGQQVEQVLRMVRERAAGPREVARSNWQRIMARIEAGEQVSPTIRRWAQEMARKGGHARTL